MAVGISPGAAGNLDPRKAERSREAVYGMASMIVAAAIASISNLHQRNRAQQSYGNLIDQITDILSRGGEIGAANAFAGSTAESIGRGDPVKNRIDFAQKMRQLPPDMRKRILDALGGFPGIGALAGAEQGYSGTSGGSGSGSGGGSGSYAEDGGSYSGGDIYASGLSDSNSGHASFRPPGAGENAGASGSWDTPGQNNYSWQPPAENGTNQSDPAREQSRRLFGGGGNIAIPPNASPNYTQFAQPDPDVPADIIDPRKNISLPAPGYGPQAATAPSADAPSLPNNPDAVNASRFNLQDAMRNLQNSTRYCDMGTPKKLSVADIKAALEAQAEDKPQDKLADKLGEPKADKPAKEAEGDPKKTHNEAAQTAHQMAKGRRISKKAHAPMA